MKQMLMKRRSASVALLALYCAGCSDGSGYGGEPLGTEELPSLCSGTTGQFIGVDAFGPSNESAYGITEAFVDHHQRAVGFRRTGGSPCTGTLISKNLFLTAGHCFLDSGDKVQFGFHSGPNGSSQNDEKDFEVTTIDGRSYNPEDLHEPDFQLLRLVRVPGDRYGYARSTTTDPGQGARLTIIQHPDGQPKRVDTGNHAGVGLPFGTNEPPYSNLFSHLVDTLGGSSGSAVLNQSGLIVGVHNLGGCDAPGSPSNTPEDGLTNLANRMSAIFPLLPSYVQNMGSDLFWRSQGSSKTFTNQSASISSGYRPFSGDFDGDGRDDIFLDQNWPNDTSSDRIWWGNSSMTFQIANESRSGFYIPIVGNFNGTQGDDIYWYSPSGTDLIWWSNGNRTFNKQNAPRQINGEYRPAAGNFDGDADDDIVWHRAGTGQDLIWWSANGNFNQANVSISGSFLPVVGNFDGDSDDDIFWYRGGPESNFFWWFQGGSFTSVTVNDSPVSPYSRMPVVGSFNGDSREDIFWYGPGDHTDTIWWFNGMSFTEQTTTVDREAWPVSGDYDGDGDVDVLWYGY
jgi:hypothetical protein